MSGAFWIPKWLLANPYHWLVFWLLFMPAVFVIDRHLSWYGQLVPAAVLWWLLIGVLQTRSKRDRVLLLTLLIVATLSEILGSLVLHWYSYRLHNIPLWVPPGHGLVFLTALVTAELPIIRRHAIPCRLIVSLGIGIYAGIGLLGGSLDLVGVVFGVILLLWMWLLSEAKGRFYTGLWFWVSLLELSGETFHAWHWSAVMPVFHFSEANPPSGIAGAYGVFDLIAFTASTYILKTPFAVKWLQFTEPAETEKGTLTAPEKVQSLH